MANSDKNRKRWERNNKFEKKLWYNNRKFKYKQKKIGKIVRQMWYIKKKPCNIFYIFLQNMLI